MEKLNFESYSENYNNSVIILAFNYFDNTVNKDRFEEETESFISQFDEVKTLTSKNNIKNLIEFIEKFYNKENNIILESLENFSIFLSYFYNLGEAKMNF
jgi:hypothetical protein